MFGLFGKKKTEAASSKPSTSMPSLDKKEKWNLVKEREGLVSSISLEKGLPEGTKSRVAAVIDRSGSMSGLYNRGEVQKLLERLIPLGLSFDDDGEVDVFAFHNSAFEVGTANKRNFSDFVQKEICDKIGVGGTNYAPIIRKVVEKYSSEKGDPAYVIFVVDGDCFDKREAEMAIREASNKGIFWQFVGIGDASFDFLEKLDTMEGRTVDNANFFSVSNIDKMSDKDLYSNMMGEYPEYLVEAKRKGIL